MTEAGEEGPPIPDGRIIVRSTSRTLDAVLQSQHCRAVFVPSPRQKRILEMIANGLTSKEIGNDLGISARTVETHLERMRGKTNARTTAQLLAIVMRTEQLQI